MTDLLYQIALFVLIIAGIMLIYVLYQVAVKLNDLGDTAKIIRNRVHDADNLINSLEGSLNNINDSIKNFTSSYEKIITAKEKIQSFFNNDKKGKKDEQK